MRKIFIQCFSEMSLSESEGPRIDIIQLHNVLIGMRYLNKQKNQNQQNNFDQILRVLNRI